MEADPFGGVGSGSRFSTTAPHDAYPLITLALESRQALHGHTELRVDPISPSDQAVSVRNLTTRVLPLQGPSGVLYESVEAVLSSNDILDVRHLVDLSTRWAHLCDLRELTPNIATLLKVELLSAGDE